MLIRERRCVVDGPYISLGRRAVARGGTSEVRYIAIFDDNVPERIRIPRYRYVAVLFCWRSPRQSTLSCPEAAPVHTLCALETLF